MPLDLPTPALVEDQPPFPFGDWERYALQGSLGEGCFGAVFKVLDRDLDRVVALKVLHSTSPARMAQLRQEARAQAQLEHPAFCRLYEVGERQGRPYLVMEWVDGRPLDEVFPGLSLQAFVRVLAELAEALDHGHRLGLAHRDLKPSNVLMVPLPGGGFRPCIVDFGLALLGEDALQARPCDLWALGELAYTLLGGFPSGAGPSSLRREPALAAPPRPRLDTLRTDIPADLAELIARCQALEGPDRFQDAGALARALRTWLAGQEPSPRRAWWWGGAALALVLAGIGVGTGRLRRTAPTPAPLEGVRSELARLREVLARDGERLRALERRLAAATREEERRVLRLEIEALRRSMDQNQRALDTLEGRLPSSAPSPLAPSGKALAPAPPPSPATGEEVPPRLLQRRVPVFPHDLLEGAQGLPSPLEVPVDVRVDAQGRAVEGLVPPELPEALRARVLEAALSSVYAPALSGGIPAEGWTRITYRFARGGGAEGSGPQVVRLAPLTVETDQFERLRALTGGEALVVQVRLDAQGRPQAIQPQHPLPAVLEEAVRRAVQASVFRPGRMEGVQEGWVTVAFPLR